MLHWARCEAHLLRHQLDPRALSARQLLTLGWDLLTEHAEPWQIELLLGEVASFAGAHDSAVKRLEELRLDKRLPKEQFSKVRRALFTARRRQRGLPVD
jgi:hypothetical protein